MKIKVLAAAIAFSLTAGTAGAADINYKTYKISKVERPYIKACRTALDGAKNLNCKCVAIKAAADDSITLADVSAGIGPDATPSAAMTALTKDCKWGKKGKKGKKNKNK